MTSWFIKISYAPLEQNLFENTSGEISANRHTVTSNVCQCVSNHWKLNWLFNRRFTVETNKSPNVRTTGAIWVEVGDRWIPLTQRQ